MGRFINADSYASTGQGFLGYNMFAYCENNPVKYIDSFGNFAWIPGAVGAITNFVTTLVCGGDLGDALKAAFWGGVFAYTPEEIVHIANGLVAAYETWVNGGSFSDVLGAVCSTFLHHMFPEIPCFLHRGLQRP